MTYRTPTAALEDMAEVSSARLTHANHCCVYPCIQIGSHKFRMERGWIYVGRSKAPWLDAWGRSIAVVFQKDSPANEQSNDALEQFEPVIYWCHGTTEMEFYHAI